MAAPINAPVNYNLSLSFFFFNTRLTNYQIALRRTQRRSDQSIVFSFKVSAFYQLNVNYLLRLSPHFTTDPSSREDTKFRGFILPPSSFEHVPCREYSFFPLSPLKLRTRA